MYMYMYISLIKLILSMRKDDIHYQIGKSYSFINGPAQCEFIYMYTDTLMVAVEIYC